MNNVYDRILRSIHGLTTIPCQTSSVTQRHWAVKKSPERWGNEFLLECCWLRDCFDFGPDDVRHPNRTPSNWFNPIAWHRTVSGDPLETKKHIQFAHHSSSQFESARVNSSHYESPPATITRTSTKLNSSESAIYAAVRFICKHRSPNTPVLCTKFVYHNSSERI